MSFNQALPNVVSIGDVSPITGNNVVFADESGVNLEASAFGIVNVGTTAVMAGTPGVIATSDATVTTSSIIVFSRKTTGGTPGNVSITSQTAGAFTLTSTGNETSTFNYVVYQAS